MPPNPSKELMSWCRINRPDTVPYMEQIIDAIPSGGTRGEAILFVLTAAFAAGRWYQVAHADDLPMGDNPYSNNG